MDLRSKRGRVVAIMIGAVAWAALASVAVWLAEAPSFLYIVVGVTSLLMAYGFSYIMIRNIR